MLDVDGVLVVHPDPGGWSARLEQDLGIDPAVLHAEFFAPCWHDIIRGRASMRTLLEPLLSARWPTTSYEALTRYWFDNDAHIDQAVLADVAALRAGGVAVHLATNQEHERAHYLWHHLDLRRCFDGLHYSADLHHCKPEPEFYRRIEQRTGLRPDRLMLIDDLRRNVDGAIACGWAAAHWTGTQTLHALVASHR